MDKNLIILIVQVALLVLAYVWGKFIAPNMTAENIKDITAKINIIINYADKFVSWANYFMKDATGAQRMAEVVKQLKGIAERYNLDISEQEITAIVQKAYDAMKAGQEAAELEKAKAASLAAENDSEFVLLEDKTEQ